MEANAAFRSGLRRRAPKGLSREALTPFRAPLISLRHERRSDLSGALVGGGACRLRRLGRPVKTLAATRTDPTTPPGARQRPSRLDRSLSAGDTSAGGCRLPLPADR